MLRPLVVLAVALSSLGVGASAAPAGAEPPPPARAVAPPPLEAPGKTARIEPVTSSTLDGWRYDQFRNLDYPCSVSGFNTFTVATRLGTPSDEVRPLWVFLHGGGIGYFSPSGQPRPGTGQKVEESPTVQRDNLRRPGLMERVREAPPGFRMLAVSMCNHDIYAGPDIPDPNNPFTTPDGRPRTVNGLFATKAAVQHAVTTVATDDVILHGGSAGSYGTYHVGWALQRQGIAPTATIADSGVLNIAWQETTGPLPGCGRSEETFAEVPRRLHPDVVAEGNQPHLLVADGRIGFPVADVYSVGDASQCGAQPVPCPLPGGVVETLGSVDCMHEPMRRAIAGLGPSTASFSMRLCVDAPNRPEPCAAHVPSNGRGLVNRDPAWPADFNGVLLAWALERLDDDGTAFPSPRSATESFATAARTDLTGGTTPRQLDADALALDAGLPRRAHLQRLVASEAWLAGVVDRLYQDTLGRPGDPGGRTYWIEELRSGRRTPAQVAASFYASGEYYRGLGGGTDASWVDDLYRKILGRSPDPGGRAYWVGQVAVRGRGGVALALHQSPESARARVRSLYDTLLGRAPDPGGLDFWAARVVVDGDLALAVSLAGSAEYAGKAVARFP